MKTRSNFVHEKDYVSEWTSLRGRVDYVMCELQKLSIKAHNQALIDLQNWFNQVCVHMQ